MSLSQYLQRIGNIGQVLNNLLVGETEKEILSGSGNWTVPADVYSIDLVIIGGGGGGGSTRSGAAWRAAGSGGGGSAGGIAIKNYAVTPGANLPYSVGAGGAGGTVGSDGADGVDSSFDGAVAKGGKGGGGHYASAANKDTGVPGGDPGQAYLSGPASAINPENTVNVITGQPGGKGSDWSTSNGEDGGVLSDSNIYATPGLNPTNAGGGGGGAAGFYGKGGDGGEAATIGDDAIDYGGGGGGSGQTNGADQHDGGDGSDGTIAIIYAHKTTY